MSSGQRPRWPEFFRHMKVRGKRRRRGTRIVLWDNNGPLWPQALRVNGQDYPADRMTVTATSAHGTRQLNRVSGYWETIEED